MSEVETQASDRAANGIDLRWDSNPQTQQARGRRPTPQTVLPLGPVLDAYCNIKCSSREFLFPATDLVLRVSYSKYSKYGKNCSTHNGLNP